MKKLTEIEPHTPVRIRWADSYSANQGWVFLDDFDFKGHTVISRDMWSVGYLVHLDKDNVFLTTTMNGEKDSMYDCFSIPIGCILDVKVLR